MSQLAIIKIGYAIRMAQHQVELGLLRALMEAFTICISRLLRVGLTTQVIQLYCKVHLSVATLLIFPLNTICTVEISELWLLTSSLEGCGLMTSGRYQASNISVNIPLILLSILNLQNMMLSSFAFEQLQSVVFKVI